MQHIIVDSEVGLTQEDLVEVEKNSIGSFRRLLKNFTSVTTEESWRMNMLIMIFAKWFYSFQVWFCSNRNNL